MTRALNAILFLTAVATLTVAPALLSGMYVQRWGVSEELKVAASNLDSFPQQFANWQYVADGEPLTKRVCEELGLEAHVARTYRNQESGEDVAVLLMVGSPGRLVRHPPDICYANRANRFLDESYTNVSADGDNQVFKTLKYVRTNVTPPQEFTVSYAYAAEDSWDAPGSPRMAYGDKPLLYKVQLLRGGDTLDSEGLKELLQSFSSVWKGFTQPADESQN